MYTKQNRRRGAVNGEELRDNGNEWTTAASARVSHMVDKSNQMPVGDLGIQNKYEMAFQPSCVGEPPLTDMELGRGVRPDQMGPTDEMYTGEPYYNIQKIRNDKLEIKGLKFHETDEGFEERNNTMDRN